MRLSGSLRQSATVAPCPNRTHISLNFACPLPQGYRTRVVLLGPRNFYSLRRVCVTVRLCTLQAPEAEVLASPTKEDAIARCPVLTASAFCPPASCPSPIAYRTMPRARRVSASPVKQSLPAMFQVSFREIDQPRQNMANCSLYAWSANDGCQPQGLLSRPAAPPEQLTVRCLSRQE